MSDEIPATEVRGRDILGKRSLLDRDFMVKTYDFKRPDKFSKEQIRTIQIVHETFARLTVVSLSSALRLPCDVTLRIVDQLTFGEFMDSLAAPTVLCSFSLPPLKGSALFHYDTGLREALLERGFGGVVGPIDAGLAARELTDIEAGAVEIMTKPLLVNLGEAWIQIEDIKPGRIQIETDPRFCQIVPPTEMIILVGLDVKIGESTGRMNIVFPYLVIEPVVFKLSAEYMYTISNPSAAGSVPPGVAYGIEAPVELLAEGSRLSIGELRVLRRGSLVPIPGLDHGVGGLRTGGREVAHIRLTEWRRDGRLVVEVIADGREAEIPGLDGENEAEEKSLERGFASIRESLEGAMKKISDRLDGIEGRQDAFVDRLDFGGADQGDRDRTEASRRPFASLVDAPSEFMSMHLVNERAQVAALVLAWLDDALASRILDRLPPPMQMDAARRVATLDRVAPAIVAMTERVLAKKLGAMGSDRRVSGGLAKIVGILNLAQRATEKYVIENLEKAAPALAEEIKKNMFVFEDISLLDGESIALLLARVDEADIVLALKPIDKAMREKVLVRFDKSSAARILARTEAMGRVRLSECDAAGQRIVEIVRRLDEEGLIAVLRPGEGI